jgi:hypothetical protein
MALKVVGSGFGRTGTNSLKMALEQLGFGPCYHMFELRDHPERLPYWQAAARGEMPDWDKVFEGYAACVDWPAARFWREIAAHYPEARVLHSVRPPESWIKSVHSTIWPSLRGRNEQPPGPRRERQNMTWEIVVEQTFGGRLDDAEHAMAVYRAHTEDVKREIAADRLLVYDVAEGWEPLCRFLGVPVPDTPFPRTNSTEEFQQRAKAR